MPRLDWAAGLFPGFFPDVAGSDGRGCRSDGRLRRPGHGDTTFRRRRQRPRRRSTTLRLALQPLHRRQRRYDYTAGRRSRFRFVPRTDRQALTTLRLALQPLPTKRRHVSNAGRRCRFQIVPRTDRHSLLLLPTTATSSSADVPWLPYSSREPTRHPAFSWQQPLEPQFPATSGGRTHVAKLHFASHSLTDSALSHSAHTSSNRGAILDKD